MFFWGEIMVCDQRHITNTPQKMVGQTKESTDTLKMLEDKIRNGEKSTPSATTIKEGHNAKAENADNEKTTRNENRSNSTSGSGEKKTKFQPMFSVFLIELILVLFSNLSTLMIRSYKNSIPLVKLNMIILISYYVVELVNYVLICQVWRSKILNPEF